MQVVSVCGLGRFSSQCRDGITPKDALKAERTAYIFNKIPQYFSYPKLSEIKTIQLLQLICAQLAAKKNIPAGCITITLRNQMFANKPQQMYPASSYRYIVFNEIQSVLPYHTHAGEIRRTGDRNFTQPLILSREPMFKMRGCQTKIF